ncbi:stage II sporulation protein M [Candidatus Micrarchaeota archaeon]|nr:stage II sporulation protein M [Candidatus Micrarchaeota archaeon]
MIEGLITPKKARSAPWSVALLSFIFVSFGIGMFMLYQGIEGGVVVLAMLPAIPLIWYLVMGEEKIEADELEKYYGTYYAIFPEQRPTRKNYAFFTYHKTLLIVFSFFFLGAVIAYAIWFAYLPEDAAKNHFASQITELCSIRKSTGMPWIDCKSWMSAHKQKESAYVSFKENEFTAILKNNLGVLGAMFLFSLLYGVGAIYLLLWNASIIGVFIGSVARVQGLQGLFLGFFSLLFHGVFELGAYFIASIAGGIFSVALMRRHFLKRGFEYLLLDILILTLIAVFMLVIGALIESSY